MSKLPIVSGAACIKALERIGFDIDRQRGSHIILILIRLDPKTTVTVPQHKKLDHGSCTRDYPPCGFNR